MSHTRKAKESTVPMRVTGVLECNNEIPWPGDHIPTVIREAPSAGKCIHVLHHGWSLMMQNTNTQWCCWSRFTLCNNISVAINLFKILKNSIKITEIFLLSKRLFVVMACSTRIANNTNKCYIGIFAVDFGPGKGQQKIIKKIYP